MPRPGAVATLLLVAACGGAHLDEPEVVAGGRFFAVETERRLGFDALVRELLDARVIYVGEQHDHEAHHAIQTAVVEALQARTPSMAIGMEMFERRFQPALDAWVDGSIDAAELQQRTEWDERWGFGFGLYRPIFELARTHGIRIIALNAPRELVHQVAQGGLDSVGAEQRAKLPEIDLEDERYRAMVERALSGHPHMDPQALGRFVEAQAVWDETMAQRVAQALGGAGAPDRVVVIAGAMHVRAGLGIPERAARRGAEPYRVVLPLETADESLHTAEGLPVADYVWIPD